MRTLDIIIMSVAAGLTLDLCVRVWRRLYRKFEERVELQQREWRGRVIDVSGIAPRIEHLRRDYVAEVHSRQSSRYFHESLLAAARQVISCLPFFSRRHVDDDHTNAA